MLTVACCLVVGLELGLDVYMVSGYVHVFILLSIVHRQFPFPVF